MRVATSPPPAETTRAFAGPTGRRPCPPRATGPQAQADSVGQPRLKAPAAPRRPAAGTAPTRVPGRPVVFDLTAPSELRPVVPAVAADTEQAGGGPAPGQARLPLGRLAGLAGSGAFAFWTSLTCFVC